MRMNLMMSFYLSNFGTQNWLVRTRQMLSEMGLLSIQSFILFLLLFYYIREMDGIKNETSQEGRIL